MRRNQSRGATEIEIHPSTLGRGLTRNGDPYGEYVRLNAQAESAYIYAEWNYGNFSVISSPCHFFFVILHADRDKGISAFHGTVSLCDNVF